MKQTKVQFSNAELDLMCDREVILTKNKVVQKIKTLLEEVQIEMNEHCKNRSELFLNDIFSIQPKISKGENYLGLPYLILDYPRFFKQANIFAIRTMFWWGNFFSTTLHLSGQFKVENTPKIIASYSLLANGKYSIGVNIDPWLHHFDSDNYNEIDSMTKDLFEAGCNEAHHLKIAKRISLKDVHPQKKLIENWKELIEICLA